MLNVVAAGGRLVKRSAVACCLVALIGECTGADDSGTTTVGDVSSASSSTSTTTTVGLTTTTSTAVSTTTDPGLGDGRAGYVLRALGDVHEGEVDEHEAHHAEAQHAAHRGNLVTCGETGGGGAASLGNVSAAARKAKHSRHGLWLLPYVALNSWL